MKWKIAVVLFVSLLSGQASGRPERGHQNTEPHIDMYSWDCKKISDYLEAMRSLFGAMVRHNVQPTVEDIESYKNALGLYEVVCREV